MSNFKKIILVEDDPFDAEMTIRALDKIPVANEILHLENGQEFLDFLESRDIREIAVVILDLQMPKVTGLEVLQEIKKKDYPYFPIVILTSSREAPDIAACYEFGVNSFVTKPVQTQEFRDAVSTLGMYWALLNEIPK